MVMRAPENAGSGSDWDNPAPGSYVGRCIRVIDLGTQKDKWGGEEKDRRKIQIIWELGGSLVKEGKFAGQPHQVGSRFTFSMFKNSSLRKVIQSWAGEKKLTDEAAAAFDFSKLLGANALLTLMENDKGYVNVDSVIRRPEAMPAFAPVNEQLALSLDPAEFKPEVYTKLSDYWKNLISRSPEFGKLAGKLPGSQQPQGNGGPATTGDDDIPF